MDHSNKNENYDELAAKWVDRSINLQEREKFNSWFHQGEDQDILIPETFARDAETHKARIYRKVLEGMELEEPPVLRKLWLRISIAASICVLLSVALYFYLNRSQSFDLNQLAKTYGHGSSVVVLTDVDGRQFLFKDSVLNMATWRKNSGAHSGFVKITTPRGSRYEILLEDGTKVWMGAASSILYPVSFDGAKRIVKLSGEAYFDVAHDAKRPFHVETVMNKQGLDIKVVGTRFNVSAYPEDLEIRTGVFDGTVKLSTTGQYVVLTKGEKVVFKDGVLQPKQENQDEEWLRAGTLEFDNDDVHQVMRMLAREYNVELVYYRTAKKRMFLTGQISRKTPLKKVLNLVEVVTDYRFEFENQKITVFERDRSPY